MSEQVYTCPPISYKVGDMDIDEWFEINAEKRKRIVAEATQRFVETMEKQMLEGVNP